jgi:hypothetical protein
MKIISPPTNYFVECSRCSAGLEFTHADVIYNETSIQDPDTIASIYCCNCSLKINVTSIINSNNESKKSGIK